MTTHRVAFLLIVATMLALFNLLPSPVIIIAEPMPVTINISQVRNSCIVNNANTALHSYSTPIDAINNWWGMPTGASYDGVSAGDLVGLNVQHAPHLPVMPFLCDLSRADWIPFSEQALQHAINQHLPYLTGIGFALLDIQWGQGAKFYIVPTPDYGSEMFEAFILMTPSPDGRLMTLQLSLDSQHFPTDPTAQQIVTCELMPLFVNSIQQTQNRLVAPSQGLEQMVVMDSSLMMRFSPVAETTPEPAPELVMAYDASCLPEPLPPAPPPDAGDGGEMQFFVIPPMDGVELMTMPEGDFVPLLLETQSSDAVFLTVDTPIDDVNLRDCISGVPNDCSLSGAVKRAEISPMQSHIILIPNGEYILNHGLVVKGNVAVIGMDAYGNDPNLARVFISSNQETPIHIINFVHQSSVVRSNVLIHNITIQNVSQYTGSSAIEVIASNVKIYNSTFINNSYGTGGFGTVSVTDPAGRPASTLTIVNSLFQNNHSSYGGAVLGYAGHPDTTITLDCVTIQQNHAYNRGGGIAAFSIFNGKIIVNDSNFIQNTSPNGGAVRREGGQIIINNSY